MKLPIRSETDAFRFTYALAFVIGISLLLGHLIGPVAGIAFFTLVAFVALIWDLSREAPGESALRVAEEAGHERGARGRRRGLVVANDALTGPELGEEILRRVDPRPALDV